MFTKVFFAICIVLIFCFPTSSIANPQVEGDCVVLYPPGMSATPRDGYGDPMRLEPFSPNTIRRILIAAHVVRSTSGSGGISSGDINTAIAQLNSAYSSAMIDFQLDQTDNIDNDTYFELTQGEWSSLAQINVIPRKLNIYFVPQAVGINGIAYLADNRCAVTNAAAINGSTLPHEVGHNFFLYHTHGHPGHDQELVNGSNCTTAGDLICDTPAEAYNDNNGISGYVYTNTCGYFGTFRDANNQLFVPDTRNFMGYAPANCRNRFSTQQVQIMNQTLSTILYSLISIPVTVMNRIALNNAGGSLTINGQFLSSGNSIDLEVGVTYPGKTNDERLQGNNKHKNWQQRTNEYRLQEDFSVERSDPTRIAYFDPLTPITVSTQLIEGGTAGNVEFRDPWYLADASGNQPNQFFPYATPYSPTGAYNQSTGGVFLNQPIVSDQPYYSVGALATQTIGGYQSSFVNWSGTNVQYQNAGVAQTGVVFTNANATAVAKYKGHLIASSAAATGTTSQRKIVNTYTAASGNITHAVYESGGSIWYTRNTGSGWSNEIAISISSTAKNPSIAYSTTQSGGTPYLYIVWTDVAPSNPSRWLTYFKYSSTLGTAWPSGPGTILGVPDDPIAYGNEPTNPVVCSDYLPAVIWKSSTGLTRLFDPYYFSWQYTQVPQTDATTRDFSVTKDLTDQFSNHLSFVQGPTGAGQVYHKQFWYTSGGFGTWGSNTPLSSAYTWMTDCANTSISNNGGQLFVTWDALCEIHASEEQGLGQPQRHVLFREFNGSSWLPAVEFTRYNYPLRKPSVGINLNTNKVVLLWELNGNTIDKTSRDISGGGWNAVSILDGGVFPSIAQHVGSGATAYSMYTAGSAVPYTIVLNSNVSSSPQSGVTSIEDQTQNETDPKQEPLGESKAFRRGAIRLDDLRFGRYERGAVRGDLWIESPTFEFVRGATRQRIPFLSDTSDFGEWLSTSSVHVPANADLIKGKIQLYIKNFRIVEPRVPMNTALFSTKIAHGGNGGNEAVKDITLADLERLGAGDTSITIPINLAAQKLRGKALRVRTRLIGQDESEEPSWSTLIVGDSLATGPGSGKFLLAKNESSTPTRIPTVFALHQNYPNPFNPATTIKFDLPENSNVSLVVYDVLGRKVAELENGMKEAGYHSATWEASSVASGMYFARFTASDGNSNVKLFKVSKLLLTK